MKKLAFLLLVGATAKADPWGNFDLQYWNFNNRPAYLDNTGPKLLYGVDMQLNIPLVDGGWLNLGLGIDSAGSKQAFNRAAGRYLFFGKINHSLVWEYKHRSEHNFDYRSRMNPAFFSTDMITLRYMFGVNPLEER